MEVKVRAFDPRQDLELYIRGDEDTFKQSFPGISIPGEIHSEIVNGLKQLQNNEYTGVYTATLDSLPIGFVIITIEPFYFISQGYIESIYIDPEYRGRGFSKALLNQAESWSKDRGARSIKLDVSLSNESAKSVYETWGFVKTRVQMDKPI